MPPTPLTVNQLSQNASAPGAVFADPAPVAADAVNGNSFPNSGKTILHIVNTDTAPHTLTLVPTVSLDGLALEPDPRIIPASGKGFIARLNQESYGTTVDFTVTSNMLQVTVYEP